jgi:hypothetical protein
MHWACRTCCAPLWPAITLTIVGGLLFVATSYAAAGAAVASLRQKIVGLLDLYRLPTLAKLGFAPGSLDNERAIFLELRRFFAQASPLASAKLFYRLPPVVDKPPGGDSREGTTAKSP